MKIYSRPPLDDVIVMGTGAHQLQLTDEQLELITALVCSCRLGQQTYSNAAYEIIDLIETQFGSDWMSDATDRVDPRVTVEDRYGNVVFSSSSTAHHITLEV